MAFHEQLSAASVADIERRAGAADGYCVAVERARGAQSALAVFETSLRCRHGGALGRGSLCGVEFFEARGGQLHGFRFRDPVDGSSARPGMAVTALDQWIGTGDGERAAFQLVKAYGDGAGWW